MIVPYLLPLLSVLQLTFAQPFSADPPAANTVLAERNFKEFLGYQRPPARFLTSYTSASTAITTPQSISPTSSSTSTSTEAPSTAPEPPDKRRVMLPFAPLGAPPFGDAVSTSTKSQATQTSTSTSSSAAAQPKTNPTDSDHELAPSKKISADDLAPDRSHDLDLSSGSEVLSGNIHGHAPAAPHIPPSQDGALNDQPPSPPLQDPTAHRLNIQRISKIPIRPHPLNNQPPSPPPSIKNQSSSPPDPPQPNTESPSNTQNPPAPMENQELIKKDLPGRVDGKLLPRRMEELFGSRVGEEGRERWKITLRRNKWSVEVPRELSADEIARLSGR